MTRGRDLSNGRPGTAWWGIPVFPAFGREPRLRELRSQAAVSGVLVAFDPEGFAGATLGGDDVFIPLQGEATIDHGSRAIATLDDPADASALHVTVSVEDPGAARTEHRGLGPGDRFSWGA